MARGGWKSSIPAISHDAPRDGRKGDPQHKWCGNNAQDDTWISVCLCASLSARQTDRRAVLPIRQMTTQETNQQTAAAASKYIMIIKCWRPDQKIRQLSTTITSRPTAARPGNRRKRCSGSKALAPWPTIKKESADPLWAVERVGVFFRFSFLQTNTN